MCGICAFVSFDGVKSSAQEDLHLHIMNSLELFKKRGPDYFESKSIECENDISLDFHASVLHLRGSTLIPQPYCDELGNILLWNGEILNGNLYNEENSSSDTVLLANGLLKAKSEEGIVQVLGVLEGPWAFIYYQKNEGLLWFGRDIFGRRSLLLNTSSDKLAFNLSSIAIRLPDWKEVPCDGIHCLDIKNSQKQQCFVIKKYMYSSSPSGHHLNNQNTQDFNQKLSIQISDHKIRSPIKMQMNQCLHVEEFEICCSAGTSEDTLKSFLDLPKFATVVAEFEAVLSDAIGRRTRNHPFLCKNCIEGRLKNLDTCIPTEPCPHSSIGVLFSGGLDSIVLAAVADRFIPSNISIDLLNVAFSCPKKPTSKNGKLPASEQTSIDVDFNTPDRLTGEKGVEELRNICPLRTWNFVMINVSSAELKRERLKTINRLIIPSCTVLDDSIGCAVWFAARGIGVIKSTDTELPYHSPCRVLLVGMGADEQLAGYSRHRGKFSANGWNGLLDELILELDRISSRNLGRDDRIISDHGREARFPFLDENVVSFLNEIPVWLKANLNYPRGVGEKLLLRLLAFKLGLKGASILPKRAIQFGSRIARSENSKEKGSNICERLKLASVIDNDNSPTNITSACAT